MAYNKLRSKLNRAVAAYLVSVGGDCGSVDSISPANSVNTNDYPLTTVRATISKPEVPMTGIRRVALQISIKGQPSLTPKDPNPDAARAAFDARVAATYDAMMQSDDGETLRATAEAITAAGRALAVAVDDSEEAAQVAANNADMAEFTCQAVYDTGEGDGEASIDGTAWEEILMFDVICSASNVD